MPYTSVNALRLQASCIYAKIVDLRKDFIECNLQLMSLREVDGQDEQIRQLRDQAFNTRIQIESLRIHARQLLDEAHRVAR